MLDRHVGGSAENYVGRYRDYGFGVRKKILELCAVNNTTLRNTLFKKREIHLEKYDYGP